ncbi:MAG TPA: hypothetical protein VFA52_02830 [Candidatus Paceibacterota bacterium]|nr:hypothetical protein [Candidatus Paceibacterota bacterium]
MDILSNLFGTEARVKLMRLFLFNPNNIFETKEAAIRTKLRLPIVKREINSLEKSSLIKRKSLKVKKRRIKGWYLNPEFPHLAPLQNLLIHTDSIDPDSVLKKFSKIGRLKVVVVAGVFIQDWDSRADLLVVADRIKGRALENIMKKLEAEIGKEMKYVALETSEFQYRLNFGDKLLRDILDYPHKVLLDKFGNLS